MGNFYEKMQKITSIVSIVSGTIAAISAAIALLAERLESQFPSKSNEITNE